MEYPTSETTFAPTKLLMPLFLTSRNRIRLNQFLEMRYYIAKKASSYAPCIDGRDENEDDEKIDEHSGKVAKIHARSSKSTRNAGKEKSWKLAPNRYNVVGEVGLKRKGMKGAFWSKLKRTPIGGKQGKLRVVTAFYEIPRDSEKYQKRCLWHKGKFLTDPRKRRPTSRFMVSNIFTCWRNPKDPGPTKYFIGIFDRERFSKIKQKPVIPYKFLRYSCVPEKKNKAHANKFSFDPGPGRYELMDDEDFIQIALEIEKQKRLKFRRLPFKRIQHPKKSLMWRHIFGYGFTRLFTGPPLRPAVVVSVKKARKVDREVNMFHSFEYIRMITNPERSVFTRRSEEIKLKQKPIRYNCLVKVIIRRQLRNNKKIAFNSGMPRFPDSDMPTTRKIVKVPPLVDQPVMRLSPSEIKSKLHLVPTRWMGTFKENRIRPFKFQPFPPVKLLLDENELRSISEETAELYPRNLNPLDFYKDEFKRQ